VAREARLLRNRDNPVDAQIKVSFLQKPDLTDSAKKPSTSQMIPQHRQVAVPKAKLRIKKGLLPDHKDSYLS